MSTEWLCRGCEVSVDKMIIEREMIKPTVSETGHVMEGWPQTVICKDAVCEACGELKQVYEYEKTEKPAEEVLSEALEIAKEVPLEKESAPVETSPVEAETVEEEPPIIGVIVPDWNGEPLLVKTPEDPYKGLTKDDLKALLKEKTENE